MLCSSNSVEVDLYLERLEDLIRRRPLLLSSVKLRQNPHNVVEWFQRVKLFVPNDPAMVHNCRFLSFLAHSKAIVICRPSKFSLKQC